MKNKRSKNKKQNNQKNQKRKPIIPVVRFVDKNSKPIGELYNRGPMEDMLIRQYKYDKKDFRGQNINIYYELLNRENCRIKGRVYGTELNIMDGDELFLQAEDYQNKTNNAICSYTEEKVNIGGVIFTRVIRRVTNKEEEWLNKGKSTGDIFGLVSGYIPAYCETVIYKIKIK